MGVLFFLCVGFVIKDMQVAIPDLEQVNVAGNDVAVKVDREPTVAEVGNILTSQVHGDLNRNRH